MGDFVRHFSKGSRFNKYPGIQQRTSTTGQHMKRLISLATLLSIALITAECSAQPPEGPRGKRGQAENGQRRQRAQRGQRPEGDRNPEQMVARMMKQFDKDGDSKLDVKELTALLTKMRERRGGGRGPGMRQRPENDTAEGGKSARGKRGQKAKQRRRNQQSPEEAGRPGGEEPTRPPAE